MIEKIGIDVSYNIILLIQHFTLHALWLDTVIYKKAVQVFRAGVINLKFGGREVVNKSFLTYVLTWHTSG